MQRSSINPSILQTVLDSASNAGAKGQAQWFTPRAWASLLAKPMPAHRPCVVDLSCGRGDFLGGAANETTRHRLGCDIDPEHLPNSPRPSDGRGAGGEGKHSFIAADLTLFAALLHDVQFSADCFVLNPPFDLHWQRRRLDFLAGSHNENVRAAFAAPDPRLSRAHIDSSVATLCLALHFCSKYGEGVMIANASTADRLLLDHTAPHHALWNHVWATVTIPGNLCTSAAAKSAVGNRQSEMQTMILYFAAGHQRGPQREEEATSREHAAELLRDLATGRLHLRLGPEARPYQFTQDSHERFAAASGEWHAREQTASAHRPAFNLWLAAHGHIDTWLSTFDDFSGRIDQAHASALHALRGKRPMQLVIQRSERDALQRAVKPGSPWTVQPALLAAVEDCVRRYHAARAPLYPLNEIQRIGYLDESDTIICKRDLFTPSPLGGERAGVRASPPSPGAADEVSVKKESVSGRGEECQQNRPSAIGNPKLEMPLFRAGQTYPLRTLTVKVTRPGTRMSLSGDQEDLEYNGSELAILISDDHLREWCFMEGRLKVDGTLVEGLIRAHRDDEQQHQTTLPATHLLDYSLQDLVDTFIIPEVPDVAAVFPQDYQRNLELLQQIESLCP